ncbi:hypothetical protein PSAC2689_20301 [Paraburkholderia sacchari]
MQTYVSKDGTWMANPHVADLTAVCGFANDPAVIPAAARLANPSYLTIQAIARHDRHEARHLTKGWGAMTCRPKRRAFQGATGDAADHQVWNFGGHCDRRSCLGCLVGVQLAGS